MRVLHVSASYKPAYVYGGPVFSVAALAEALVLQGVITHVIATNANGNENLDVKSSRFDRIEGVSVDYYPRYLKGFFFSPGLVWSLWKDCRKYDVIHINSWWNFVSVCACLICVLRGITPIVSLRGTMSDFSFAHRKVWFKSLFHRGLGRFLLKKSRIHFTSKGELEQARRWFSPSEYFILRNITAIPSISPSGNGMHDKLELVYVGRLHPIKNLEIFIDAIRDLNFCRLHVYGEGDPKYVTELKKNAGQNVRWMGWVDGVEKFKAMRDADVFILISQYENFGNVLVEALSQGTAVICAKGIGISDFIEDMDLGWTVDPKMEEIRKIVRHAWSDSEKRKRIRETAPGIINRSFSQAILGAEYVKEYQKAILLDRRKFASNQRSEFLNE